MKPGRPMYQRCLTSCWSTESACACAWSALVSSSLPITQLRTLLLVS